MNHFAVYLKLTQHCKSTVLQYKIKIKKNGVKGDQEKKISTVNFWRKEIFVVNQE